jgi:hypothetical protein
VKAGQVARKLSYNPGIFFFPLPPPKVAGRHGLEIKTPPASRLLLVLLWWRVFDVDVRLGPGPTGLSALVLGLTCLAAF